MIDAALLQIEAFKTANISWLDQRRLLVEGMLSRVVNLHLLLPGLRTLFCSLSPEAAAAVDAIGKASLYTSLYFERGSEQDLHRDTPYFWTNPPYAYAGVWLALEDSDKGNGALRAVPGSHLLGEPDRVALRQSVLGDAECPPSHVPLFEAYNAEVLRMSGAAGLGEKILPVQKGDIVVWNASTLHGGSRITERHRSRKSFVMHVTPRDVSVNHMHMFFHPDRPLPSRATWGYLDEGGRSFAAHGRISVLHQFDPEIERFDKSFRLIGDP